MALRYGGRKLSFDVLTASTFFEDGDDDETPIYRSNSGPPIHQNGVASNPNRRKRKKKKKQLMECSISENSVTDGGIEGVMDDSVNQRVFENGNCTKELELESDCKGYNYSVSSVVCEEVVMAEGSGGGEIVCTRSVANGGGGGGGGGNEEAEVLDSRIDKNAKEEGRSSSGQELDLAMGKQRVEQNGDAGRRLGKGESLDWKKFMEEDPNYTFSVEKLPVKYFMEEMHGGNSLRRTTTLGNEKERERVYDTIFRLPWRCELDVVFWSYIAIQRLRAGPHLLLKILKDDNAFAAYRCWLLRLFRFVSVTVDYDANKDSYDLLEAS
ncbi:unnamed protein product [Ilex paraguariensis]|uniref:Uncharacterized protein n=1 Tax=Ilex paraguariensis TaxID=185542 RepID=A0ABC8QXG3_9AQUA